MAEKTENTAIVSDGERKEDEGGVMSFGEHLDALRKVIVRILSVTLVAAIGAFCLKEQVFKIIMAPLKPDFITFQWVRDILESMGTTLSVTDTPTVIATEITSQFMVHITMSIYAGILIASPYIFQSLLGYVLPALYENEKKYAVKICVAVYALFVLGLLLCYFVMFPVSCRFLANYSVSPEVTTMIDITSYLSLFTSLSLLLGAVFQLPVIAFFLARTGLINASMMRKYRKHAIVAIAIVAAIITPPDLMSQILVGLPLLLLYEISIMVAAKIKCKA